MPITILPKAYPHQGIIGTLMVIDEWLGLFREVMAFARFRSAVPTVIPFNLEHSEFENERSHTHVAR